MELEKRYVPVTVHFDAGGKMRPIEIEFDETRRYHIDKILDVRRAACQSVGGVGDRYTCRIRGQERVPSRFMRKIVCRLRLSEVSRQ